MIQLPGGQVMKGQDRTDTYRYQPSTENSGKENVQPKQMLENRSKIPIVLNHGNIINIFKLESSSANLELKNIMNPILQVAQPTDPTDSCLKRNVTHLNDALVESFVTSDTNIEQVCAVSSNVFMHVKTDDQQTFMVAEVTIYWCNFCCFKSDEKEAFLKHVLEHRFHCKFCTLHCFSRAAIIRHCVEQHPQTTNNLKICSYSPDIFYRRGTRKRKSNVIHSDQTIPSKTPCHETSKDNMVQPIITNVMSGIQAVAAGFASAVSDDQTVSAAATNVASDDQTVSAARTIVVSDNRTVSTALTDVVSSCQTPLPFTVSAARTNIVNDQAVSATLINVENGSQTGSAARTNVESGSQTGSAARTNVESGSQTGSAARTNVESGSQTGSAARTNVESGSQTGSAARTNVESGSQTGSAVMTCHKSSKDNMVQPIITNVMSGMQAVSAAIANAVSADQTVSAAATNVESDDQVVSAASTNVVGDDKTVSVAMTHAVSDQAVSAAVTKVLSCCQTDSAAMANVVSGVLTVSAAKTNVVNDQTVSAAKTNVLSGFQTVPAVSGTSSHRYMHNPAKINPTTGDCETSRQSGMVSHSQSKHHVHHSLPVDSTVVSTFPDQGLEKKETTDKQHQCDKSDIVSKSNVVKYKLSKTIHDRQRKAAKRIKNIILPVLFKCAHCPYTAQLQTLKSHMFVHHHGLVMHALDMKQGSR